MRPHLIALLAFGAGACTHVVTNEERLDAAAAAPAPAPAGDLRCRETSVEIQLARDQSQQPGERLSRYGAALSEARHMARQLEAEAKRDPDLVFGAKSDDWKRRQAACDGLVAALEREQLILRADTPTALTVVPAGPAAAEPPPPPPAPKKARAEAAKTQTAATAADDAFGGGDADALRKAYKDSSKKAKAKKAKKGKRRVSVAAR